MPNRNSNSTSKTIICNEDDFVKTYETYIGRELTLWVRQNNKQQVENNRQTKILLKVIRDFFLIENTNGRFDFLHSVQKKFKLINLPTKNQWLDKASRMPISILKMITKYSSQKKNNFAINKLDLAKLESKIKTNANKLYKKHTYGCSVQKAVKYINSTKVSCLLTNKLTYSHENNHAWYAYYQYNITEAQKIMLRTGCRIIIALSLKSICPRPAYKKNNTDIEIACKKIVTLLKTIHNTQITLMINTDKIIEYAFIISILEKLAKNNEVDINNKIGVTMQAYKKDCLEFLNAIINLCTMLNKKILVRLVKGGNWQYEVNEAKRNHCCPAIFTKKISTEIAYLACAKKLIESQNYVTICFATNNTTTIQGIKKLLNKTLCEFHYMPSIIDVEKIKEIIGNNAIYVPHIIIGNQKNTLPLLTHILLNMGQLVSTDKTSYKIINDHTLCRMNNFIFTQIYNKEQSNIAGKTNLTTISTVKDIDHVISRIAKQKNSLHNNSTNPQKKIDIVIQSILNSIQNIITATIIECGKIEDVAIKEIVATIKHLSWYKTIWSNKNIVSNNKVFLCLEYESPQIKDLVVNIILALLTSHPVIVVSNPNYSLVCNEIVKTILESNIFCKNTLLHMSTNDINGIKKLCLNNNALASITNSNESRIIKYIAKKMVDRKKKLTISSLERKEVIVVLDNSVSFWEICDHIINQSFIHFAQSHSISLLCIHEDIYKKTLFALMAAIECLNIDSITSSKYGISLLTSYEYNACKKHYKKMLSKTIYQSFDIQQNTRLFPPTLYSVNSVSYLKNNPIGPVLGVMKYANKDLIKLLHKIEKIDNNHIVELYTRISNVAKISQWKTTNLALCINSTADSNLGKPSKITMKKKINEFIVHSSKKKRIRYFSEFYNL
ncbi:hypothetical protein CAXC1_160011 [Candidatus Xenohaliotis californiensis]|uniref:Proline dehydrogenase domain-containing protein n=1 Tax=Candidatus Xenohaliotis californiensis TaxID=84677 RepID=A0ABP0ERW8_9RICK|nr:hypothetical protein CAXC1_160011 [Candidatus Xenohaliotis californiensis]